MVFNSIKFSFNEIQTPPPPSSYIKKNNNHPNCELLQTINFLIKSDFSIATFDNLLSLRYFFLIFRLSLSLSGKKTKLFEILKGNEKKNHMHSFLITLLFFLLFFFELKIRKTEMNPYLPSINSQI